MSDIKRLRVFLSAPGDVLAARAVVRDVTHKLATDFEQRGINLDIAAWDDPDDLHSLDAHLSPDQARALGRPLPAECDVVVVIVWSRMGTLVREGEAYLSATHYEFESAIRAAHPPRVLVYRWTAPVEQAWEDFATGETAEQRQQQRDDVERFVVGIRSAAIPITPFASMPEFEKLLTAQLPSALADALGPPSEPASATSTTARAAEANAEPPIIFLSAVSDEFRGYREHLKRALEHAAQVPSIIQEYFDAVGQGTLGGLDARVRCCTAVVHLIGDMPGYFPPPNAIRELVQRHPKLPALLGLEADALLDPANAISYTQWEAYLAILHGKHLFLAEAARDARREPVSYRREPKLLASQQVHRERLRKLMDRWHELLFDGPDDIASKLLPALSAQHPRHFSGASIYSLGARQFDAYYLEGRTLDGKNVPAPFGGRQREIEHLDRWLDDPARDPRLLVSAPAGRGKSALLAQWMKALRDAKRVGPDSWLLVFVPISNRFQTNRATTYLELLVRQLAQASGEYVPPPSLDAEQFYRNKANQLMSGLVDAGKRVLLVIDGLDEALGDERLANLLPTSLPPTFKVLVSARWIAEDRGGTGWLTRLGWTSASRPADHDLVVEKLDVGAIEDVLARMGAPIEPVGRDRPLLTRLAALTEGEPLLLRFYAEDLWLKTSARSPITLDVLDNMQPGFGPYFKTWLQDQGGVAADAGMQVDRNTTDATLAILGFAKGALTGKDLLAICHAGFPDIPKSYWRLVAKPHVAPFRRFVIGDGSDDFPYVFSHPKVGEFIRTDECKELADQAATAFYVWGRGHVARLNATDGADRLRPEQASRYALDHYADHLKDVGDTATGEDYMAMVEDGWRRAKEQHDGGPAGFAADVRSAWTACRRDGDIAHLGAQWRCALTLSSIKSIGTNIPGALLVELARHGTLSPQQARHFAEIKGPTAEAVEALARIAVAMDQNRRVATDLAVAAVELARSVHDKKLRVDRLVLAVETLQLSKNGDLKTSTHLPLLAQHQRASILHEALASAKAIDHKEYGCNACEALAKLAQHLDTDQLVDALAAVKKIDSEKHRSRGLEVLAPYLSLAQRADALETARTVLDEQCRSQALAALAQHLDEAQRASMLAEALAAAKAIRKRRDRSRALATVAVHLDAAQRVAVLADALAAAKAIAHEDTRSRRLGELAPHLDPTQRADALAAALRIESELGRSTALAGLGPYLDVAQRADTLVAVLAMRKEQHSSKVLTALAPHLDPTQRADVFSAAMRIKSEFMLAALAPYFNAAQRSDALSMALAYVENLNRSKLLAALAPHLAPDQIDAALTMARSMSAVPRSEALAALAPYLQPIHCADALAAALAIDTEEYRSKALAALSPYLDPVLCTSAVVAAQAIVETRFRAKVLVALAPHLSPSQYVEAMAAAKSIGDVGPRSFALAALAPCLAPTQRAAVVSAALSGARAIGDSEKRSRLLITLAPYLDEAQRDDTLAMTSSIYNEFSRSKLLAALAACLEGAQLADAMAKTLKLRSDRVRVEALAAFIPRLEGASRETLLDHVFALAKTLDSASARILALVAIVPHLDPARRSSAISDSLVTAIAIEDPESSARALMAIAPYLDADQRTEALRAARNLSDLRYRFMALWALAPHLDTVARPPVLSDALDAAKTLGASLPLAALAPLLDPALRGPVLADALSAARAIKSDKTRLEVMAKLVVDASVPEGNVLLLATLEEVSNTARANAFDFVANAVQPTSSHGGSSAMVELHRAINDVCMWYP